MKSLVRRILFVFVSSSAHFAWQMLMKQLAEFGSEWEGLGGVVCDGCVVECRNQGHELGRREKGEGRKEEKWEGEMEEEMWRRRKGGRKERGRKMKGEQRKREGGWRKKTSHSVSFLPDMSLPLTLVLDHEGIDGSHWVTSPPPLCCLVP